MAAVGIAGCSSEGSGGDYSQYFQAIKQAWNGQGKDLTLQQVGTIPYATIGYRIGDGRQIILILATDTQGQRLWTSAEHVVLVTAGGRIISSAGLERNFTLSGTNLAGPAAALQGPVTTQWTADFADIGRYSVPVTCIAQKGRPEAVSILGQALASVRIDERCKADSLNWSFTNSYWVTEDGSEVWRSVQHIHPAMDPVEVETFRPAE